MEVGLGLGDFVLDGDPAPLPKRGAQPSTQSSTHAYCDQMAGCIRILLGTEVCLGPGDIVLDGGPAPTQKRARPQFWARVYCGETVAHLRYC